MTGVLRRLPLLLGVLGALVFAVGGGFVVADANARTAAAVGVVDELTDLYDEATGYSIGSRASVLRSIVSDSIVNDGPMPVVFTESTGGYPSASYGAFGGIYSYIPLQRPWSPRMIAIPLAVGGVLAVTATLVAASRWTPRTAASRRPLAERERARRGRPAGS